MKFFVCSSCNRERSLALFRNEDDLIRIDENELVMTVQIPIVIQVNVLEILRLKSN